MSVRDVETGTVVDGRYRIQHRIGSGGMADVYCAIDDQLGRKVALKMLHRRFAEDEEFVERFRREASSAAGLQHPNVVGVFDRGEWDGTSYIAMEYLEGRTLKQVIVDEAPLDPVRAIDLTVQILRAARFAHKRGVIHRDLKPHNVIVDAEGRAKVTDFGIARAGASDMTQTGSIMGTAQYLSPEQAQGHAVDERSDLYAIGIVLYEMLTGRLPFDGESAVTIALKQVSEPPVPPRAINAAVPPELEAVVLRTLEKDPDRRPRDADELIAVLEHVRGEITSGAASTGQATTAFAALPPAGPVVAGAYATGAYAAVPPVVAVEERAPRRWPWVLLAVLAVLGLALAAYALTRPERVVVPNVVGKPFGGAQTRLRNAGFDVRIEHQHVAGVPRDRVFRQDPQPNTKVDKGSTVTLQVSDGPSTVTVPDVTDLGRNAATKRLKALGLVVTQQRQPSADVKTNHVIASSPGPNTPVPAGSTVTLTVSSGPERVTMPDVTGQSETDARAALEALGLTVTSQQQPSGNTPAGTVLAQSPAKGTKLTKGATVTLTVAKEPDVKVPDVVGKTESDAVNAISDAGLSPTTTSKDVTTPDQDGIVLSQKPGAGGKAKKGDRVVIVVGRFNPALNPDPGAGNGTPTTTTTTP
jgi:serine/threonine-protein kinase